MASKKYFNLGSNLAYLASAGAGGLVGAAIASYTLSHKRNDAFAALETRMATNDQKLLNVTENVDNVTPDFETSRKRFDDVSSQQLLESIKKAQRLCERVKARYGLPGLSVAVTVNGKPCWMQGFGYANLENEVKMEADTVVRIGSISKSMTMAMLAKFMEDGKVDIDLPVQTYVPNFPKKEVDGKEVTITTRHLLSHLSGIRHYSKKEELDAQAKGGPDAVIDEMNLKEYFLKDRFASVEKSLELFQNDALLHEPGSKYHYTTHGYTLVSAVVEKIAGKPFEKYAKQVFQTWGLKNTFLDEPEPLIYNRAAAYSLDKKSGRIQNSPYVDNSYKWAGGGFVSTVGDIAQFGNIVLASYQNQHVPVQKSIETSSDTSGSKGYLKSSTVEAMWRGDPRTAVDGRDDLYAQGFRSAEPMTKCLFCHSRDMMTVQHGGAAIGGSAMLQITFPKHVRFTPDETDCNSSSSGEGQAKVKGISVAVLTNLTGVGLKETTEEITKIFEWLI